MAFSEAWYEEQEFSAVGARGFTVAGVEFCDCAFSRCDFAGAEFRDCRFDRCTFTACDLSLARVPDSRFSAVQIVECRAVGIDWSGATARAALELTFLRSDLSQSVFLERATRRLSLLDCVAREVEFAGADLRGARFAGTDLSGARFLETELTEADFRGARGYFLDPSRNRVRKARFALPEAVALLGAFDIILE